MRRNKLVLDCQWIRVGCTFVLIVNVEGEIFSKQFRVESVEEFAQPVIELNKKLKQFDLADQLKKKFGVKKVVFGGV